MKPFHRNFSVECAHKFHHTNRKLHQHFARHLTDDGYIFSNASVICNFIDILIQESKILIPFHMCMHHIISKFPHLKSMYGKKLVLLQMIINCEGKSRCVIKNCLEYLSICFFHYSAWNLMTWMLERGVQCSSLYKYICFCVHAVIRFYRWTHSHSWKILRIFWQCMKLYRHQMCSKVNEVPYFSIVCANIQNINAFL